MGADRDGRGRPVGEDHRLGLHPVPVGVTTPVGPDQKRGLVVRVGGETPCDQVQPGQRRGARLGDQDRFTPEAEPVLQCGRGVPVQVLGNIGQREDEQVNLGRIGAGRRQRPLRGLPGQVAHLDAVGRTVHGGVTVAQDALDVFAVLTDYVGHRTGLAERRPEGSDPEHGRLCPL